MAAMDIDIITQLVVCRISNPRTASFHGLEWTAAPFAIGTHICPTSPSTPQFYYCDRCINRVREDASLPPYLKPLLQYRYHRQNSELSSLLEGVLGFIEAHYQHETAENQQALIEDLTLSNNITIDEEDKPHIQLHIRSYTESIFYKDSLRKYWASRIEGEFATKAWQVIHIEIHGPWYILPHWTDYPASQLVFYSTPHDHTVRPPPEVTPQNLHLPYTRILGMYIENMPPEAFQLLRFYDAPRLIGVLISGALPYTQAFPLSWICNDDNPPNATSKYPLLKKIDIESLEYTTAAYKMVVEAIPSLTYLPTFGTEYSVGAWADRYAILTAIDHQLLARMQPQPILWSPRWAKIIQAVGVLARGELSPHSEEDNPVRAFALMTLAMSRLGLLGTPTAMLTDVNIGARTAANYTDFDAYVDPAAIEYALRSTYYKLQDENDEPPAKVR
jgi:hypothetical protein